MRARSLSRGALLACAVAWSSAAFAVDVCAIFKSHAPRDMGLQLDRTMSPTPEFCQALSAGNKDTLMLRIAPTKSAPGMVLATKPQQASGEKVADEAGLGAGAWSKRDRSTIEITFGTKDQFVQVVLDRKEGLGDADAAKAREFAKAVAKSL